MQNSDPTRFHAAWHSLCSAKGVIVPGGFGHRGTEGKMMAIRWCREKKVITWSYIISKIVNTGYIINIVYLVYIGKRSFDKSVGVTTTFTILPR